MRRPFFILSLLLPSLCLTAALVGPRHGVREAYGEVFASDHLWIDVSFPVHPRGYFQVPGKPTRLPLRATVTTDYGEIEVSGFLVRTADKETYFFRGPGLRFQGELVRRGEGACDSTLKIDLPAAGRSAQTSQNLSPRFCREL